MFQSISLYDYDVQKQQHTFEVKDPCLSQHYTLFLSPVGQNDYRSSILWNGLFIIWLIDFYKEQKRSIVRNLVAYFGFIKEHYHKSPSLTNLKEIFQSYDRLMGTSYYLLYYPSLKDALIDQMLVIEPFNTRQQELNLDMAQLEHYLTTQATP